MTDFLDLADEIASQHNISTALLIGHNRRANVIWPRFELMWRARHELNMSLLKIARAMGRHHTTIMHGIDRHEHRRNLTHRFD
jgi:chromosomal replication initiation ATPase DnaA